MISCVLIGALMSPQVGAFTPPNSGLFVAPFRVETACRGILQERGRPIRSNSILDLTRDDYTNDDNEGIATVDDHDLAAQSGNSLSEEVSRRKVFASALSSLAASAAASSFCISPPKVANAAPPMAVIAEELGYFPVTSRDGTTIYIPGRVKRSSTDQSIELAKYLERAGVTMYGAYWCPHCSRQREMFGKEAWSYVNYVECSPKGYNANLRLCGKNDIEGFPTWKIGSKEIGSGEMTLDRIAAMSGYGGKFDGGLEEPLPMGGGSCR